MATFANWLAEQSNRDDAIGYAARYWASVTPGRISSITGVGRHLEKVRENFADTDDERGKASIAAAISGYELAVREYHRSEALQQAIATGAIPPPRETPDPSQIVTAREPDPVTQGDGTGEAAQPDEAAVAEKTSLTVTEVPPDRLSRMEARLERLEGLLMDVFRVTAVVSARTEDLAVAVLPPEPVDWEGLWAWWTREAEQQPDEDPVTPG